MTANHRGNFLQNVNIKAVIRYDVHSWIPVLGSKTCLMLHYGSLYGAIMRGL